MNQRTLLQHMQAWMDEQGFSSQDLDEFVHEGKAAEAASINNGGQVEQLTYLIGCFGGNLTALQNAVSGQQGE